jgi:hypothetical protein
MSNIGNALFISIGIALAVCRVGKPLIKKLYLNKRNK